jgi:hypothetical protein
MSSYGERFNDLDTLVQVFGRKTWVEIPTIMRKPSLEKSELIKGSFVLLVRITFNQQIAMTSH